MSRQWSKPVMAFPASRSSFPIDNGAASAGASPHSEDHLAVRSSWLHDHMLHEHGRDVREIDGLPLEDLHHFEHVEQAMGLIDLGHQHQDPGTHELVSTEPNDASLTEVLEHADSYLPPSRAWSVPA